MGTRRVFGSMEAESWRRDEKEIGLLRGAALPSDGALICGGAVFWAFHHRLDEFEGVIRPEIGTDFFREAVGPVEDAAAYDDLQVCARADFLHRIDERADIRQVAREIGRASCRERV